jgi:ArsR family transcriptional regulator
MKRLARIFKALSDETRLRILHLVLEAEEICVCDMETVLGCPQARISRHLAILKNAGWIEDRREGMWVLYSLAKPADPIHQSLLKAVKEIVRSSPEFDADRAKLRKAFEHGRCKTFQTIMPDVVPKFFSR